MTLKSPITTHVLDTALGRPAEGVDVVLSVLDDDGWRELGRGTTSDDGRITDLFPGGLLEPGPYQLTFGTGAYFWRNGMAAFHPSVTVEFQVISPDQHYHVPLLISPFGYTTYRGS